MLAADELAAAPTHPAGGGVGGVPPYIWTACTNARCNAYGVRRQIWLKQIVVGVVALPGTLLCAACCQSLPYSIFQPIEEELMPKIHNGRGPTDKNDIPAPADVPPAAVPAPVLAETFEAAAEEAPMAQVEVGKPALPTLEGEPGPELAADAEPGRLLAPAEVVVAASDPEGVSAERETTTEEAEESKPDDSSDADGSAALDVAEKPTAAPRKTAGRKAGGRS